MATQSLPTNGNLGNTPSTYRPAGSCSFRAYVVCDDTPYHLETPVTVFLPNPHYNPELVAKLAAIRATRGGNCQSYRSLKAIIDSHPEASAAELVNLVNQ